jgi:hypothetical protein
MARENTEDKPPKQVPEKRVLQGVANMKDDRVFSRLRFDCLFRDTVLSILDKQ